MKKYLTIRSEKNIYDYCTMDTLDYNTSNFICKKCFLNSKNTMNKSVKNGQ